MQQIELTKEYLEELRDIIHRRDDNAAIKFLQNLHAADIAGIYSELTKEEAKYLFLLLDGDTAANVLSELETDDMQEFLNEIPSKNLAKQFIDYMDSDDAADAIGLLPEEKQEEVLSLVKKLDHAGYIVDLLNYEEDSAGGLMAKELLKVNENWTVMRCLKELGNQATEIEDIYYIYVVDDNDILKGIVGLKQLLTAGHQAFISEFYDEEVISVKADTESEEVSNIMDKYDLVALPVTDSLGRLIGRITIDDVVDVIRDEAEKNYQMISGITEDVEPTDRIFTQTRARLPWLLIGLFGGIMGALVIGSFEEELAKNATMAFFIPLIAAMGGNVGVQSSSIIVQSLATKTMGMQGTLKRIGKEFFVALINAIVCSSILFAYNVLTDNEFMLTITISAALLTVIIFASIIGTVVPLVLNKLKIDPALATGPFITTINDILGILVYFSIAKFIIA